MCVKESDRKREWDWEWKLAVKGGWGSSKSESGKRERERERERAVRESSLREQNKSVLLGQRSMNLLNFNFLILFYRRPSFDNHRN